jgi:thymidylate synthase (FAD)
MQFDPLGDGKSAIALIDRMGSDLSIVNDARASFDKSSDSLTDKDAKLINYLIKHRHTSPFRGVVFKFKIKAPLFVARQWWKHAIASAHSEEQQSWNERSYRYVEVTDSEDFYVPQQFRSQSANNKQASGGELDPIANQQAIALYEAQCRASYAAYSELLKAGVSREQARGVLVPSVYTSWVWTVSLQGALHFCGLRSGEGAQSEIALYAMAIEGMIKAIVPVAYEAWVSNGKEF